MPINLQDFILESKLFKTFYIDDLLFVEYKCLVNEEQSNIWTHHNYFAYVFGGQKKWKTAKGEYLVSSGEAIFVKKGANMVYQYFEEPFFVLFIFLPDQFIRDTIRKYPECRPTLTNQTPVIDSVIPLTLNEVLNTFFQSLFSYFLPSKPPSKAVLKLKMEELILNVFSQPENQALKQCFSKVMNVQKTNLEELMKTHFTYPFSIKDYARLSARSLSTFRRDFKATFHTTPSKWLIKERLAYSKLLVETTSKSINEIIYESGFKNRSHFMRLFKEAFGYSPKQFQLAKLRMP